MIFVKKENKKNKPPAALSALILSFVALGLVVLAPVPSFGQSAGQTDAVLLVDMSGSVWRTRRFKKVKKIFDWGIEFAGEDNRVALVTLGDKSRVSRELATIKERDFKGMTTILTEHSNRTDVAAGLEQAYYMLKTKAKQGSERVIVLFSDGIIDLRGGVEANEASAKYIRDILIPEMTKEAVRVFVFVPDGLSANFPLLQELTLRTGGEYYRGISKTPEAVHALISGSPSKAVARPVAPQVSKPVVASAPVKTTPKPQTSKPQAAKPKASQPQAAKPQVAIAQTPKTSEPTAEAASANSPVPLGMILAIGMFLVICGVGAFFFLRIRKKKSAMSGILEDVQQLRGKLSSQIEEENDRVQKEATAVTDDIAQRKEEPESNLSVSFVTPYLEYDDLDDTGFPEMGGATDDIAPPAQVAEFNAQPEISVGMMETLIGVGVEDLQPPERELDTNDPESDRLGEE